MRYAPGKVREAILQVLATSPEGLPVSQIEKRVAQSIGPTPGSSIRSCLRLKTPETFIREERGVYRVRPEVSGGFPGRPPDRRRAMAAAVRLRSNDTDPWRLLRLAGGAKKTTAFMPSSPTLRTDCMSTTPQQQLKMRQGMGGVWRIPPSFDGHARSPLPRFTILTDQQRDQLGRFFTLWGRLLLPRLVPGANVVVASNPPPRPYRGRRAGRGGHGVPRQHHQARHDHAGRRQTEGRPRGVQRCERDAGVRCRGSRSSRTLRLRTERTPLELVYPVRAQLLHPILVQRGRPGCQVRCAGSWRKSVVTTLPR